MDGIRVLQRPWFPADLEIQRAHALLCESAAFRKQGVYLSLGSGGCVTKPGDALIGQAEID